MLFVGLTAYAAAQDQGLTALQTTMRSLARTRGNYTIPYAGLAIAKRQLRDWVEANLASLPQGGDEKQFAARLNSNLRTAHLTCIHRHNLSDKGSEFCPDDESSQGYLDEISAEHKPDFLAIIAGVGLPGCQSDESIYAYQWIGSRWQRVWQDEQTGTGKTYEPQWIRGVELSDPDKDGSLLALVLGSNSGCASVFRPIYYRVWRFGGATPRPKLMLKRSELADIGGPLNGRVNPSDVLIEFTSINEKVNVAFRHITIRHYSVQGDSVRQLDPVALTPLSFLNEWFDADWSQSAAWSESASLERWHRDLEYIWVEDPKRCQTDPALWQAEVTQFSNRRPGPEESLYFLIRWNPPYRFTVAEISGKGRPDCTIEDPRVEETQGLFGVAK